MPSASKVNSASIICNALNAKCESLSPTRSRSASANSQAITSNANTTWICVSPITSSSHCAVLSGVTRERPSATATRHHTSNTPQNNTAGPRRGPPANNTQRSGGSETARLALTLGVPRDHCGRR